MPFLVGSTPTLILGLCLLVLVGSLPAFAAPPASAGSREPGPIVLALAAVLASAALIRFVLALPGALPDTFPGRIAKYGAAELNTAQEPNVLIIDGGSYVLNAVDCDDLMAELQALGHPTRAVRLAAGAANHFERYRLQQWVVRRLKARRPSQHWTFLAEVQQGYDTAPLAQFTENKDTERTYDYATPDNAWYATKALRSRGVTEPPAWRWQLLRSALINGFNVNALLRLEDEEQVELGGGRVTARKSSKFKFTGLSAQIDSLDSRPRPAQLPWLRTIRERRIQRLWRPYLTNFAYFGVPSTAPEQLDYVRSFCAAVAPPCLAPADLELLKSLDSADNWRDRSHMSKKGSRIYSRWLAHELVRQGLVN